jgi:hypothetical protein
VHVVSSQYNIIGSFQKNKNKKSLDPNNNIIYQDLIAWRLSKCLSLPQTCIIGRGRSKAAKTLLIQLSRLKHHKITKKRMEPTD